MASQKDSCCAGDGTHYSEHNEPDLGKTDLCKAKRCIAPAIANSQYCLAHQQKAEPTAHTFSYNEAQLNANCSCGWRFQDCSEEFGRNQWNDHMTIGNGSQAEPAAQQECPIQGMDSCKEIISTVVNHLMTTGQLSSAIHDEALLQKVGQLMPRTWEPTPTPSREELAFIKQAQYICEMGEPRTCDIDLLRKLGKVAYPHGYKKLAEASALGTKEE